MVEEALLPRLRIPDTLMLELPVIPAALLMVRLLNDVAELPPIVAADEPLKVTVLLPGLNVPLLDQLPATEWAYVPALKVAPLPTVKLPEVVTAAPAVAVVPLSEMEKLPATVIGVPGMVLAAPPLRLRFPYVSAVTV
jgi:hypothetical protein